MLTVVTVYVICWLPYWCAQVWLTFMPPDSGQNTFSFTMMLLTGCLSYANSAVNPVLYAFLSDNFKKSFAKAFVCAARREVNAQLHGENSVFPKSTTKGSTSRQHRRSESAAALRPRPDNQAEPSTAVTVAREVVKNGINNKQQLQQHSENEVTQV